MLRCLVATFLLFAANVAVAQTPTPAPDAACDALCQVNRALKPGESDKPTVGSRAGNAANVQQKNSGPVVPGAAIRHPDATK